ncbi:MAG: DEAD/DEAH box helicase [Bacteroidetes bacterium]|nr:DEAD/DEAH box helicase [Bacteroidota bacterium]
MGNFKDLGINKGLLMAVEEMGFTSPTAVQEQAIPYLLKGKKDLIALAQTGTGKTAAFGLPCIQQVDPKIKHVQTIILCPTRELCIQISKDLLKFAKHLDYVKIIAVYGGTSIENQIKSIKRGVQIVVGTPGRTKDLIKRRVLKLDIVNKVVLDEADEMLSMGFKEDLNYILNTTSENRQTMLFSATMSREVRSISKKFMKDAEEITVEKLNSGAKNVEHHVYNVNSRDKYDTLKRIADFNPDIYGIVFCRTRRETQDIANKFMNDGYNADAIHGELSQGQRDEVMSKFRDKSLQILIATDVAARGLDVDSLTHVINYSLPDDPEVYTHRSGRTGRAGKSGISIAISNSREGRKLKSIENKSQINFIRQEVPSGKEICSKQLLKLIEKIQKVKVDEKQIEPFLEDIYLKLESFSREDLIKHFVSAEFNKFLDYYNNSKDVKSETKSETKSENRSEDRKPFKERSRSRTDFSNLSVNIGRTNGVTPIELISLVNRIIKSNEIEIGAIDIRESYSIFEIDAKAESDLIKKGPKINFNGVSLEIKISKEKVERKFQRDKKSKSNFKSKRSGSQREFKGRSDRRSKNNGRYNG